MYFYDHDHVAHKQSPPPVDAVVVVLSCKIKATGDERLFMSNSLGLPSQVNCIFLSLLLLLFYQIK